MDFSNVNIVRILKSSLKNRFYDFPPQDFEDFVAQLFKDNKYRVEQTNYSGDYGVDVIASKNNENIAIQVKRYSKKNKVGVKDINQVYGGMKYYNCQKALIITTSSFSKQSKKISEKNDIILWDWDILQKFICDTYLDGLDYYDFFSKEKGQIMSENEFTVNIREIKYKEQMKGNFLATLVYYTLTNNTDQNIFVEISDPIIITSNNQQVESNAYLTNYFKVGTIYTGCTVKCCAIFLSEQLPRIGIGDKFIVEINEKTYIFNIEHNIPSKKASSGCFIATEVFNSQNSYELQILKKFREIKLKSTFAGKIFIYAYYSLGPIIANFIHDKENLKKQIRKILLRCVHYLDR